MLLEGLERELLKPFVLVLAPPCDDGADEVWFPVNRVHACGALLDGVWTRAGARFWAAWVREDCVCVRDCAAPDAVRLVFAAPGFDALACLFSAAVWPAPCWMAW